MRVGLICLLALGAGAALHGETVPLGRRAALCGGAALAFPSLAANAGLLDDFGDPSTPAPPPPPPKQRTQAKVVADKKADEVKSVKDGDLDLRDAVDTAVAEKEAARGGVPLTAAEVKAIRERYYYLGYR